MLTRWTQLVIGLILLLAALPQTSRAAEPRRPNIVFILADDLGWGDPSCYGNKKFKTPTLDRLAHDGTLFTQYYQGGSVCSPSRCSMQTGRWPAEFRIHGHYATPQENTRRDMSQFLDPTVATLPKLLKAAGYTTVHVGKWHLGRPPNTPKNLSMYGFDQTYWLDAQGDMNGEEVNLWNPANRPKAARTLVDSTLAALDQVKDKPFYCELWLNDPHAPLAPSAEQMKPFHRQEPAGFTSPFEVYAATVTEMDRQIGRLLDRLDELKLSENTIVLFSSDNGPEDIDISNAAWSGIGSPGPLRGRKRSLYEGGVRLPFIFRWPGHTPAGKINDQTVVSGTDLLPTLCELTGVSIPDEVKATLRGQSVVPGALGNSTFARSKPLFWEWRFRIVNHPWNRSPMLAIREGKWKLLMNPDRSRIELYDIPTDSREQDNLAAQQPDVVASLSEKVLAWRKTLPPGMTEPGAGRNDYPWPSGNK